MNSVNFGLFCIFLICEFSYKNFHSHLHSPVKNAMIGTSKEAYVKGQTQLFTLQTYPQFFLKLLVWTR